MIIEPKKEIYSLLKDPLFIYELIDPETNEIRYIGKTKNLKKRYRSHLYTSKLKRTHKECWINKLLSKNKKPIMKVKIITVEKHINDSEQREIKNYKNLTNLTGGGDGQSNISLNTISKIKLTKNKNKKWKFKNKKEKPVVGYNLKTGEIISFKSATEAERTMKFNQSHITSCCKKRKHFKQHKGYVWRYTGGKNEF